MTGWVFLFVLVSAACKKGKLGIDGAPCKGKSTAHYSCDYGLGGGKKVKICCENKKTDGWLAVGTGSGMEGSVAGIWSGGTSTYTLSGPDNFEKDSTPGLAIESPKDQIICFEAKKPSSASLKLQWAWGSGTLSNDAKKHDENGNFVLTLEKSSDDSDDTQASTPTADGEEEDDEDNNSSGGPALSDDMTGEKERKDRMLVLTLSIGLAAALVAILALYCFVCRVDKAKKKMKKKQPSPFAEGTFSKSRR